MEDADYEGDAPPALVTGSEDDSASDEDSNHDGDMGQGPARGNNLGSNRGSRSSSAAAGGRSEAEMPGLTPGRLVQGYKGTHVGLD